MSEQNRLASLTGREFQTFSLIVEGRTTREISLELGVSVRTIEHHRRHVYEKLQVRNVAETVRYAALAGWFSPAAR